MCPVTRKIFNLDSSLCDFRTHTKNIQLSFFCAIFNLSYEIHKFLNNSFFSVNFWIIKKKRRKNISFNLSYSDLQTGGEENKFVKILQTDFTNACIFPPEVSSQKELSKKVISWRRWSHHHIFRLENMFKAHLSQVQDIFLWNFQLLLNS